MEDTMSTATELNTATQANKTGSLDLKLEVVILPVSDADRAKEFYASIGWREDADFVFTDDFRVLQFTPPGSQASIIFGTGVSSAVPGSGGSMIVAVDDIEAARTQLIENGVDVSDIFHGSGFAADGHDREPGLDPERKSYSSYASFSDPDGNTFLMQEVTSRLPGRVEDPDVGELAALLLDTAMHHDSFEKAAPEHNWWDWYAPYLSARQQGSTEDEATEAADRYMKDVHGIVRSR
jgi:catechol 2,3-dioxygenase-like lactoylglutathione lyase family enzyme